MEDVATRCVFRAINASECVCGRSSTRTPLGELTVLPWSLSRRGEGKERERTGRGKGGEWMIEGKRRRQTPKDRLQKTHLFCTRVRFGRLKSSKVDDFGTNRKCVCDFLLVHNCDYGLILHRFWDTATYWLKLPIFPTPLLFAPPLPMFPLEFRS